MERFKGLQVIVDDDVHSVFSLMVSYVGVGTD
jgi:hypothetical protein